MSFAKNFGSKYGKKFLNKGISAPKRIKDTGNFIKIQHLNLIKVNMEKFQKIKEVNLEK